MGTLIIDESMYFQGNVRFSVPHTENRNNCFILADGNITIEGNGFTPASSYDIINLYSIHGMIRVDTSNSNIRGVLYTSGVTGNPLYTENVGNILVGGNNNVIEGSIVSANNIEINSSNTSLNYPEEGLSDVKGKYYDISVSTFDFREAAKRIVDKFAGTDTKMGVMQYGNSANNNSFLIYDLSMPDGVAALKTEIDSIATNKTEYRNLGDGLRRAYYTLKNQPLTEASKYIITLSASEPNKWTSADSGLTGYKSVDGRADFTSGDGSYDEDNKGLNYAKSIGGIIKSDNIEPIFVDYSNIPTVMDKVESVAVSSGAKEALEGVHYYVMPSVHDFYSVIDSLYMKPVSNVTLNNVRYEEIYPAGVKVVNVPDGMTISTVDVGGKQRYKVSEQ
ncbi:MAG: hypothetical protein BWY74_04273 [Firmicutes bacterium ADurb.Bin419]|nr:MAG: hypothetical protein BWY74_04273 [Firmicutes bacterium ADurb.Bin419]